MTNGATVTDELTKVARDLLNLEVNTILKDNITGQKMPPARHAMVDIGDDFCGELTKFGVLVPDRLKERLGSYAAFDFLQESAKDLLEGLGSQDGSGTAQSARYFMLRRIKDMSDQMKGMMNALKARGERNWENDYTRTDLEVGRPADLQLLPHEFVLLRKIWEITTEVIIMQTVIQVDGDVVTRFNPGYAGEEYGYLQRIHREGVQTSVEFWRELIQITKDMLRSLFELITSRS